MTSSGGSKLRLSICNDYVKLITHTAVEYTAHNHHMHQRLKSDTGMGIAVIPR